MFKLNINVERGKWKKKVPDIEKVLLKNFKIIFRVFKKFTNKNLEASVLLTDKKNFYLNKIKNKTLYLGDLAFSYDYIEKQKIDFLDYLNKIFIHGCLHLIGYEHNNLKNYKAMSFVEKKLLIKI